jgi:alkanesulfonate monooxygenase SsuD/methylene tetrahydromethanopterin reductase-like flavin-dependent oxidoreductase (luciferase family)
VVLCDPFRHPGVLARQPVSIGHASQGRFDLGIGWGSAPTEFATFGTGPTEPASLCPDEGNSRDPQGPVGGRDRRLRGSALRPAGSEAGTPPAGPILIVVDGAGRQTMELVAAYADWWNVHIGILDKVDQIRPLAGAIINSHTPTYPDPVPCTWRTGGPIQVAASSRRRY